MSDSFEADCRRFMANARLTAEQLIRATAIALYQNVTLRSPVDTGRFRANWRCDINNIDKGTDANITLDPMRAVITANGFKVGDYFTIANSLPYAEALEEGWSKQAPAGMIRLAIKDIKDKIESGGIPHD